MLEGIVIGLVIGLSVWGVYAWWIYKTARRYGKRGDGRH
jgi:hypothetical protein